MCPGFNGPISESIGQNRPEQESFHPMIKLHTAKHKYTTSPLLAQPVFLWFTPPLNKTHPVQAHQPKMAPFTFYTATIQTSLSILTSLTNILQIAETKHSSPSDLLPARLAPDMRPLTSQIHLLTQAIQRLLARLKRIPFVPPEDEIRTFEDIHARILATKQDLEAMDVNFVNRRGDEVEATVLTPDLTKEMSGADFAMGASMPNIYFHLNMVYAILRMEGVQLGKWDYIGGFMGPVLAA